MSLMTIAIAGVLAMAVLAAPLFAVIAALAVVSFWALDGDFQAVQTVIIEMNRLAGMPVLVALPLFTLAGNLLTATQAPRRIMTAMDAAVGWMPGGIAVAGLGACAFFTALTGASGVTIVAIGSVLYPILREQAYGEKFSLGLLTTGGSLGLLFPPSLPIILYGVVSRTDIGALFKAGILPGILIMVVLAAYAAVIGSGARYPRKPFVAGRLWSALVHARWEWPIILVIVGGVYGGLATVAEVSALVVVYIGFAACVITREIDPVKTLPKIVADSAVLSGAIVIILGASMGLTGYLVDEQIPDRLLGWLTGLTDNRYLFLAGLNLLLLGVGCVMDIFSAIIIIVPIIIPIATAFGIDPIHLCIIFLVNLEIGYITPPVGMNLFIAGLKFNKPITLLYRSSVPYLLLLLGVLVVVTYWPALSLVWQ